MTISFKVPAEDLDLISLVTDRAHREIFDKHPDIKQTRSDTMMDLSACHANGMPLDLKALLEFPAFDFSYDVMGIRQHINRTTGEIEGFFVPRCAVKYSGGK